MPRGAPGLGFSTTFWAGLRALDEPGQKPLAWGWEWSGWAGTSSQDQRLRASGQPLSKRGSRGAAPLPSLHLQELVWTRCSPRWPLELPEVT